MSNYTYMITNKINGKVYVGSHCWKGEGLDPDYFGSGTAITRAVKKYGKKNFQVEVLYYYDTVEECRQDEERILTEYNVRDCPYSYNCKNSAIGWTSEDVKGKNNPMYGRTGENNPMYGKRGKGSPNYGKHHTDETRKKISRAKKGKTVSEEHRKKLSQAKKKLMTPIVAIQIDTGKVKIFESQMECSRVLGIYSGKINDCLKGRRKTYKGYTFKKINRDKRVFTVSQRSKADLNRLRGVA